MVKKQTVMNIGFFFITAILVAIAFVNYTDNRRQDLQFQNKGKRFTYCDGMTLQKEINPSFRVDDYCKDNEKNTDFQQFINQ